MKCMRPWIFILLGNVIWITLPLGLGVFFVRYETYISGPSNAGERIIFMLIFFTFLLGLLPLNLIFSKVCEKIKHYKGLMYWNSQKNIRSWFLSILCGFFILIYLLFLGWAVYAEFQIPKFYFEMYAPFILAIWYSLLLRSLMLTDSNVATS